MVALEGIVNNERVGVFIDVSHLHNAAAKLYGGRVDIPRLVWEMIGDRRLVTAHAFLLCHSEQHAAQTAGFRYLLQGAGITPHWKQTRPLPEAGREGGNWAVGIAAEVVYATMEDHLDTVILVSGHRDFVDLCVFLRSQEVRVEVCAFERALSSELRAEASAVCPIEEQHLMRTGARNPNQEESV